MKCFTTEFTEEIHLESTEKGSNEFECCLAVVTTAGSFLR